MLHKLFEAVDVEVKTTFGILKIRFTVIDILPNYHYALIAQNKIVVGQEKCDGSWVLSDPIDLLCIKPQ